jgi:threonine/homoserine/homoserine lactone efflux protein
MLGIHHYWLFIATAIVLILTPGQDIFFILGRSLAGGRAAGIAAAASPGPVSVNSCISTAAGMPGCAGGPMSARPSSP